MNGGVCIPQFSAIKEKNIFKTLVLRLEIIQTMMWYVHSIYSNFVIISILFKQLNELDLYFTDVMYSERSKMQKEVRFILK